MDLESLEPYFSPFEDIFLRRREEILQLVGLATHSMRAMEGSARLAKVLKYETERAEEVRESKTRRVLKSNLDFRFCTARPQFSFGEH